MCREPANARLAPQHRFPRRGSFAHRLCQQTPALETETAATERRSLKDRSTAVRLPPSGARTRDAFSHCGTRRRHVFQRPETPCILRGIRARTSVVGIANAERLPTNGHRSPIDDLVWLSVRLRERHVARSTAGDRVDIYRARRAGDSGPSEANVPACIDVAARRELYRAASRRLRSELKRTHNGLPSPPQATPCRRPPW